MAINLTKLTQYANEPKWRSIPEPCQGAGEILDDKGNALFGIFLTTHRDIITQIGYKAAEGCPEMLLACAAAVCELAAQKPVISAHLLGPAQITPIFCGKDEAEDELFYFATIATMAMRNAVASYADFRKRDLEQWKTEHPDAKPHFHTD